MPSRPDLLAISNKICAKLEGYSTAAVGDPGQYYEEDYALTNQEELALLRIIDGRIFCCAQCGYWQPQRDNATPNGQNWICKECHRDDDSE